MQAQKNKTMWDIFIRFFHWLLVICFIGAYYSAEFDNIETHALWGIAIFCLLIFRILWGIIGSQTARFSHFITTPRHIVNYITTLKNPNTKPSFGHNPLGGISVIAMLSIFLIQTITGLFSNDDIIFYAPFSSLVSEKTSSMLTNWHKINFNIILFLIITHISAILFYNFYKKNDLITPMITGKNTQEMPYYNIMTKRLYIYGILCTVFSGIIFYNLQKLL